jgi:hypothetical protein
VTDPGKPGVKADDGSWKKLPATVGDAGPPRREKKSKPTSQLGEEGRANSTVFFRFGLVARKDLNERSRGRASHAGAFRSPRLDRLPVLGGLDLGDDLQDFSAGVSIRRLVCATSLSGRTLPLPGYAQNLTSSCSAHSRSAPPDLFFSPAHM